MQRRRLRRPPPQGRTQAQSLSGPGHNYGDASRPGRRPTGKARRVRILSICERGATQPGGMPRRSNAAVIVPVTTKIHRMDHLARNSLVLKRMGIDTHEEPIVYMRSDCHVCRSEGFSAHSRVTVTTERSWRKPSKQAAHASGGQARRRRQRSAWGDEVGPHACRRQAAEGAVVRPAERVDETNAPWWPRRPAPKRRPYPKAFRTVRQPSG